MPDLRIGIDVGGTNTDAALVTGDGEVVATAKVATTEDPADGVAEALAAVAARADGVRIVALGTTHALNAILQRRGLRRVAVVRIGAPGTLAVEPLLGWPGDLRTAVAGPVAVVRGGVEVDGRKVELDPVELHQVLRRASADAQAVAICGSFSLLDPSQERSAADVAAEVMGPEVPITLGSDVGGTGLLERENAAVLNAALGGVASAVIRGFTERVGELLPGAKPFLTQNDGTLMAPERALALPILTVGSGPANSLRGAVALTGLQDGLVVDIGGTSTDVGAVTKGFPRESAVGVRVGGVATNFRMPDLVSVAVGGGTIVDGDGTIGTESVGRRLTEEALVFGGRTPTLTDAAVAAGRALIGDIEAVRGREDLRTPLHEAESRVADAIDRMKVTAGDIDVTLVGGGNVLMPDELPGVRKLVRPGHADVANAVGAALAPVAGESDRIADVGGERRPIAVEESLRQARERASEAGADPDSLETIWLEEVPLAYMDRPLSRIRVKVAGPAS